MSDFEKNLDEIYAEIKSVLLKKNADYGNASRSTGDDEWNLIGNQIRLYDKVNRYKSLLRGMLKGRNPNFEGIEDTIMDIIGHGFLGKMIYNESSLKKKNIEPNSLDEVTKECKKSKVICNTTFQGCFSVEPSYVEGYDEIEIVNNGTSFYYSKILIEETKKEFDNVLNKYVYRFIKSKGVI